MTRPLMIAGANKVFKAPPGMDNCYDIYVRQEIIDGITYHFLEVELEPAEREAILAGGTLILGQMGTGWQPLSVGVKHPMTNPFVPISPEEESGED